jgi:hypothetical protein
MPHAGGRPKKLDPQSAAGIPKLNFFFGPRPSPIIASSSLDRSLKGNNLRTASVAASPQASSASGHGNEYSDGEMSEMVSRDVIVDPISVDNEASMRDVSHGNSDSESESESYDALTMGGSDQPDSEPESSKMMFSFTKFAGLSIQSIGNLYFNMQWWRRCIHIFQTAISRACVCVETVYR